MLVIGSKTALITSGAGCMFSDQYTGYCNIWRKAMCDFRATMTKGRCGRVFVLTFRLSTRYSYSFYYSLPEFLLDLSLSLLSFAGVSFHLIQPNLITRSRGQVGAGPVGLVSAVSLAHSGIKVRIIDSADSYTPAAALASSLALLSFSILWVSRTTC
ncbi:hypothetical protein JB92DRAFT_2129893 [Gautieria morchelliformis]|nr:hypothetical protein JB92DRAFT_2129893 [Gautieria morchelliformis]